MERMPVTSALLKSVGWENGVLEAEFPNGACYRYGGVSRETFEGLMGAKSVGQYFNAHIKPACTATKVTKASSPVKAALAVLLLVLSVACADEPGARKALEDAGFTEITLLGYEPWLCDTKTDTFATRFRAKGPTGRVVTGAVCSGYLKGKTIRFE